MSDQSASRDESTGSTINQPQHPLQRDHTLSFAYQTFLRNNIDEQSHYNDVCRAYRQYANFAIKQFGLNYPNRIANLPASSQTLLPQHLQYGTPEFHQRLQYCKDAAIRNQFLLDCILRHAGQPISQQKQQLLPLGDDGVYATEAQLSKVTSVLKSLARDWSVEGTNERNMCYQPILRSVQKYLPPPRKSMNHPTNIKICVPGAGVGRLACELAAVGYTVQGNEFSLYMLLASDFILNGPVVSVSSAAKADTEGKPAQQQQQQHQPANKPHPLSISPWLLETRNVHNMIDPFRTVQIPDVDPFDMVVSSHLQEATTTTTKDGSRDAGALKAPPTGVRSDFSMTAGDFRSIYSVDSEANAWDGVASCFFLDASPNIIEYLQTIYHMLKPNGIFINFGPLHWHWSGPAMLLTDETMADYYDRYDHLDSKYLQSYDYCWEDIQTILLNIGFSIIEQTNGIPAHYTADQRSMIQTEYRCIHFVAQKKINNDTSPTISS